MTVISIKDRIDAIRARQAPLTQADARAEHEAFMASFGATLTAGLKLKRVMQKRGLRRARAKCPRCGFETLQGALVGRRDHLRMWCDTPDCPMEMME
ncbi:hypothetical protein [Bosea sp. (in: a-proteobacteria)]|jgi:hypothetical protein|uniref:hypothetical protein n=1 Tax=Bosea sp. (in: a-proteobacteria) TaxID=1871050 RepID=UPI003565B04F